MELAELLEAEGLDGDEVLAWAKGRADELTANLPEDMDLDGLLADMPKLEVVADTPAARPRPGDSSDKDLLGDEDSEFEALNTGMFEVVEEGIPEEAGSEFDTGPLPEAGAPSEEMEIVESAELEEVSEDELEELDADELIEFQSGEYEIVDPDEEPAEASRPPAPPPAPASRQAEPKEEEEPDLMALAGGEEPEAGAPEKLEDAGSFDIDLDLDI